MNAADLASIADEALLLLSAIALLVAMIGAGAWWIAAHPEETRAFVSWLMERPSVKRVRNRNHRQIAFLVRRLRPEGAFGLSFTIGLAALATSIWVFGALLEDILAQEEIVRFDVPIASYIADHRVNWLAAVMEAITRLGSGPFLIAMIIAAGLALRYRTGSWQAFALMAAALLGSMLLDFVAKVAIARPRPPAVWMAVPVTGWAFPSGHSTQATAAYGALAYAVSQTLSGWRAKVVWLATGMSIAFLIGVSRIYLGVHWPTDVIGGWALGFAWLVIVFTTASTIQKVSETSPLGNEPGTSRSETGAGSTRRNRRGVA